MIALGVVSLVLALVFAADGLRLRGRVAALATLAPSDEPVSSDHRFLIAPGVALDEATRRAASAHARRHGLAALDLVPGDLDAPRLVALVQTADPARYRKDRLAPGRTAGHAALVTDALLTRSRVEPAPADPAAFVRVVQELKRYACTDTDLAIAPALREVPEDGRDLRPVLRAVTAGFAPAMLGMQLALLAVVALCALFGGRLGLAALALYHLQPLLVCVGIDVNPRLLWLQPIARWPLDLWRALRTALGPARPEPDPVAPLRPAYAALLADGPARFFEPRLDRCPVCGDGALAPHVTVPDMLQHKPGRFTLERCGACGHLFQNPRLSIEGLSFYYRDFYDGLGGQWLETVFAADAAPYFARARSVEGGPAPRRWLDVGGGHAHFCCLAREVWPEASFDCLDISETVEEGVRRGWADRGYRGLFPELAPTLASSYDVVSMSHYLEHTRDPRAEIAAAFAALAPGGALMVEVPDPESRLARWLGRLWLPFFQPQHQHLLSVANLKRLMDEAGFTVERVQRGEVHIPVDFAFAALLGLGVVAPPVNQPWRPPGGPLRAAWHSVAWTLGAPLLVVGFLADRAAAPFARRPGWSNAYRVVARKRV